MALTSIALNNGVTLQGRALARNGAVTMIHDTIDSSSCAAPSPTATPKATPTSGTNPATTPPPTDTLASTNGAVTDPVSAALLALLAVSAVTLVGSLPFRVIRSRSRD